MTEFQKEYYSGMIEFLSAVFGHMIEISLFEVLANKKTSLCAKSKNCLKDLGDEVDRNLLFCIREYKKSKSILQNYHGKKKMEICLEFLFTIFKTKKRI